jgi:nucleotide-binding universal stress UspA family protein
MTYRIVAGVDGSSHSCSALRWAVAGAAYRSGEVVAVYAWQVPFSSFPGISDREDLEQLSKEFLIDVVSGINATPDVPLYMLVAGGDPAEALIAAAEGADLLVLGSRGRSPVKRLLHGWVARDCVARSPCPVVLVTSAESATSSAPVPTLVDPSRAQGWLHKGRGARPRLAR